MATSAFSAFVDAYQALTGVPNLYTFDVPPSASGAPVFPPYAVLQDEGLRAVYEFEHTVMEVSELVLLVYAPTLQAVDAAVERVKYNGGAIGAGQGMDFNGLTTLSIDYKELSVQRLSEKRFAATPTGQEAQRIHGCEMRYRVSLYRYSAN